MFENPKWKALKKISAPKEAGDSYIIDASSSGIYTPVLEGIAHKNPRGWTVEGYKEEIARFYNASKSKTNLKEAYTLMLAAFLIAEVASHVYYFGKARNSGDSTLTKKGKDKLKFIESILKFNSSELIHLKNLLYKELEALASKMKSSDVESVNKEYKFTRSSEKSVMEIFGKIKPPEKSQDKKSSADYYEKIKKLGAILEKDNARLIEIKTTLLPDLEYDIEANEKSRGERRSKFDKENIEESIKREKKEREELLDEAKKLQLKIDIYKKALEPSKKDQQELAL